MPIYKYIIVLFLILLLIGVVLLHLEKRKLVNDFLQLKLLYSNKKLQSIIKVKISGCVKQPGYYQLKYGSRLKDLIKKSGGLTFFAGKNISWNSRLKDGNEYLVSYRKLKRGELINVNSAGFNYLCMVPGMNKKIACNILDYRKKHGKFKIFNELLNISGIGEKKIELIKKYMIIGE